MPPFTHTTRLRVRYAETDQMGTFYNSRALEWFEVGRTEWFRAAGIPYAEMETRGLLLPLIEAHVEFRGRARYDDLLEIHARAALLSKVRLRFDMEIVKLAPPASDPALGEAPLSPPKGTPAALSPPKPVAAGYTIHALLDPAGKPTRAPAWFLTLLAPPDP